MRRYIQPEEGSRGTQKTYLVEGKKGKTVAICNFEGEGTSKQGDRITQ